MSIKLMSVVWELNLPPGEKLVLLALADQANDEGTHCWPSGATISKRSGQNERTVRRALRSLEGKGHLTCNERRGTSTNYVVHPGHHAPQTIPPPPAHPTDTHTNPHPPRPPPRSVGHPGHSAAPGSLPPRTKPTQTPDTTPPHPGHHAPQTINETLEPSNKIVENDNPVLKPEHVKERWNELAEKLGKPKVRDLTPERRQLLKARIAQYDLDDFISVFGKVERSPFLRGDTGWQRCTFDWIFKKANFQKALEGNYDN